MSKYLNILTNVCNDTVEDLDIFPFELDDFQKHACVQKYHKMKMF